MDKLSAQVDGITNKLNTILSNYLQLKQQQEELQAKNKVLNAQLEDRQQVITDLEEQLKLLKISKSVSLSESDNKELKAIIKEIIKEVDKCMAMLNN